MPDQPFANHQYGIYLGGLGGVRPSHAIDADALQREAEGTMTAEAYGYVAGGAGSEDTMRANRDAFRRWRIVPRMLRDVSERNLAVHVLNTAMDAPVMVAPIGVQSIIHPDGELAVARAAAATGVPMIASTASSYSMEEIADANGDGQRWYQLYWPKDPALATSFVQRAERAGYEAIVITLDTTLLAWRPRDLQQAYLPFLNSIGIANYLSDPVFRGALEKTPEEDPNAAVMHFVGLFSDPSKTWGDIAAIRGATSLPILLKGILHPEDARAAVAAGVDGVIVSNHGGRQVDGAVGALDALPWVMEAVGAKVPVLFDSGVRGGGDAFKALALGAAAVLLGRPVMWGLGVGGRDGAEEVLKGFLAELDLTFALSGYTALDQIGPETLVREGE